MASPARIHGLLAAPYTPMAEDGRIRPDAIPQYAEFLKLNGVAGVFINGTTGESMSLGTEERKVIAEAWVRAAGPDWPVIVHVGTQSLPDTQGLAAHAAGLGAAGIAIVSPCYYKPRALEDLIDFCAPAAAAAGDLPFYYYHIPCMTGVSFRVTDFLRRAAGVIPSLRGAKFSSEDLVDAASAIDLDGGKYELLYGKDEMSLPAMTVGARGFVGSTYNFAAPLYNKMGEAFAAGDMNEALRLQLESVRIVEVMDSLGGARAGKAIMKLAGLDCGPPRLPQRGLNAAQMKELEAKLEVIGFETNLAKPANAR